MMNFTEEELNETYAKGLNGDAVAKKLLEEMAVHLGKMSFKVMVAKKRARLADQDLEDGEYESILAALLSLHTWNPASGTRLKTWIMSKAIYAVLEYSRHSARQGLTGHAEEVQYVDGPISSLEGHGEDFSEEEDQDSLLDTLAYGEPPEGFEPMEVQVTRDQLYDMLIELGQDGYNLARYYGIKTPRVMLGELASVYGITPQAMGQQLKKSINILRDRFQNGQI